MIIFQGTSQLCKCHLVYCCNCGYKLSGRSIEKSLSNQLITEILDLSRISTFFFTEKLELSDGCYILKLLIVRSIDNFRLSISDHFTLVTPRFRYFSLITFSLNCIQYYRSKPHLSYCREQNIWQLFEEICGAALYLTIFLVLLRYLK